MSFDAQVNTIYDQLVSHAAKLGVFDGGVNPAEPWATPGSGVWCAFAAPSVTPAPKASGLAAVSARLEFLALCGCSALLKPVGRADKVIMTAALALMAEYAGAFTLGGQVRDVDLLGETGAPLSGRPGFMTIGEQQMRVYQITLPLVVNDLFAEVA